MGFSAKNVSKLDYDFSAWKDDDGNALPKGDIPEPSPLQIAAYWGAYSEFVRAHSRKISEFEKKLKAAEGDQDTIDALEEEYQRWTDSIEQDRLADRKKMLAALCSDSPDFDTLDKLPGRPFVAFERYMQEEISPLGSSAATQK